MSELELLERRLERERKARKMAEALLEEKSRALYLANEDLQTSKETLAAAKAYTDNVLRSMLDTLIVTTPESYIQAVNPATCKLLGYAEAELLGQPLAKVFGQQALAASFADLGLEVLAQHGTVNNLERFYVTKDGKAVPMLFSGAFMHNSDGSVQGVVCEAQNITERKLLEAQLAQAQKLESIGQLAAGVAHEINTPIQYVGDNTRFLQEAFDDFMKLLGKYQDLQRGLRVGAPHATILQEIQETAEEIDAEYLLDEIPAAIQQALEGVERVAEIVRAMKEFSHPGTEQKTLVDLNKTIESTLIVARNEWKYVAEVVNDFDTSLPKVPCFPGDFNQVVLNIVVNAAHAIAEAHQDTQSKGRIVVRTHVAEGWVEVRITDNGGGIPEAVQQRIFDPFFTTKEVGKGTGQGLAISRDVIVKKHGGSLTFETEAGKGSTFIIRLPLEL